jgi:hypothetical protein
MGKRYKFPEFASTQTAGPSMSLLDTSVTSNHQSPSQVARHSLLLAGNDVLCPNNAADAPNRVKGPNLSNLEINQNVNAGGIRTSNRKGRRKVTYKFASFASDQPSHLDIRSSPPLSNNTGSNANHSRTTSVSHLDQENCTPPTTPSEVEMQHTTPGMKGSISLQVVRVLKKQRLASGKRKRTVVFRGSAFSPTEKSQ